MANPGRKFTADAFVLHGGSRWPVSVERVGPRHCSKNRKQALARAAALRPEAATMTRSLVHRRGGGRGQRERGACTRALMVLGAA